MLYCQNPEEYAAFLADWCLAGYPEEQDLYVARAILTFLSKGNLNMANKVYSLIQQKLELTTPLMHFCQFLLATLERDAYPLFKLLREKYEPELQRDPSFNSLLNKIAKHYFHIQQYSPNLFANMFDMFKRMN